MPPNALSTARHSHRRFVACLLGWDDVSLSGATTAVTASDRYVIRATITAEAITLFNAALAGAGRDYQTISGTVATFLHLLTRQVP
jgi:hypothetical protein